MSKRTVRDSVLIRDEMRCTRCGLSDPMHQAIYGRGLHIHRTTPCSEYTVEGCETLCEGCHENETKIYFHGPAPLRAKVLAASLTTQEYGEVKAAAQGLGMKPCQFVFLAIKRLLADAAGAAELRESYRKFRGHKKP